MSTQPTKSELKRADDLEEVIVKHYEKSMEFVQAAYLYKEEKLYRFRWGSWANFCIRRLNVSRETLDRNIRTAKKLTVGTSNKDTPVETGHGDHFSDIGQSTTIPSDPVAARALADVPEEKRDEVMESLADAGMEPTPKAIRVAASVAGVPKKPMAGRFDGLKPHVHEDFENRHVIDSLVGDAKRLAEKIEYYRGTNIGTFLEFDTIAADMANVVTAIKFAKPWSDCVLCQQAGCKRCRNRGWLNRPLFNQLTDDLKKQSRVRGGGEDDE